jgi:hypothetical protein
LEQAPPVWGERHVWRSPTSRVIADIVVIGKSLKLKAIAKIASTAKIVNLKKTGFWLLAKKAAASS